MSKLNNEATKNVLDTQQQQESASENEESDSVTDQSSSATSESATHPPSSNGKSSQTTQSSSSKAATQFSVQRSDADGLRMRISAIRPASNSHSVVTAANTPKTGSGSGSSQQPTAAHNERKEGGSKLRTTSQVHDKVNNNNTIETLKVKISNKPQQQKQQQTEQKQHPLKETSSAQKRAATATKMSVDAVAVTGSKDNATTGKSSTSTRAAAAATKTTTQTPAAVVASSDITATSTAATTTATTTTSTSTPATTNALPLATLLLQAPCLSDATAESGCSEATTTTVAAGQEKSSAKKIKVKRKKTQSKHSDSKKSLKKSRHQPTAFSSDSEDDVPLVQQQRAPRLLLTAINSKIAAPQIKPLTSLVAASGDNIGLSSSDNELKLDDVVSAAIKRVESDTDDTGGEVFRKAKTKNLPQYQSTLLQDFMEKTQMLGRTPARLVDGSPERTAATTSVTTMTAALKGSARAELLAANQNSNSQSESIASSSPSIVKRRRGRPKKIVVTAVVASADAVATSLTATTPTASVVSASNINESADSGVVSTTSTTQSTSPSPKLPSTNAAAAPATFAATPSHRQRLRNETETSASTTTTTTTTATANSTTAISPAKSQAASSDTNAAGSPSTAATQKPKIDIAYLDKRMYATERVLYPPPRNKRRQSTSTGATSKSAQQERKASTATAATTAAAAAKTAKEELQLDPVWRKIDVNKKFRRPSVSGYKSDGGGGNTTICSKILAAQSGYVSDYGSFHPRSHSHHHNSGYKSDASGKSRYSVKSCVSRRSRAKSCGYRSDCKESGVTLKSTKYRRKRRCALMKTHSKSVGNLNDEQDILQLAGLSLGQSSEESNEYVCKPNLESLPTTSVSKKYGEINRFIATGEYFGRGSSGGGGGGAFGSGSAAGSGLHSKRSYDTTNEDGSQDGFGSSFSRKLLLQRKHSLASCELTHEMLPHSSRKIKSRRSSVASYCSSYYSSTSKVKRRRRRKSFRFPSSSKPTTIDSKLLTEIEIITNTFGALCRIQSGGDKVIGASGKDKLLIEAVNKLPTTAVPAGATNKRETRDKRSLKKRKMSENHEFALLSAGGGALTPSSGSTKRRHKKASSSSPDDHKLPLKKRHYLLTPGEKSTEAAAAVAAAAKLFGSNPEAWAAAAAAAKSSAVSKSQQQFGAKSSKTGLTPKKRHLLQNATHLEDSAGSVKGSNSSPLRIMVDTGSNSGTKMLDISPISLGSSKQSTDSVHKKRTRLEGLVSKIANHSDEQSKETLKHKTPTASGPQLDSETSCPPPGVFEPSVELEIQIPPIAKLSETASSIITKSEVNSPLLLELNKTFPPAATKVEGTRVVEALLSKTGGNLLLKRKRKKINRTGFPTVRRKKRRLTEQLLLDIPSDVEEDVPQAADTKTKAGRPKGTQASAEATGKACDRVPQAGEASDTFLERANRTPRLSVVALERLQGTPTPTAGKSTPIVTAVRAAKKVKSFGRQKLLGRKPKLASEKVEELAPTPTATASPTRLSKKMKLQRTDALVERPEALVERTKALVERPAEMPKPLPRQRGRKPKAKTIEPPPSKVENELKEIKEAKILKSAKESKPAEASTVRTPTKQPKKFTKTPDKPTFSKSTVHKIITAKSLESKVKLPAGIDPNTNFRCKIRLKRRSTFQPPVNIASSSEVVPPSITRKASTPPPNPEDVAVEAAAKDAQNEYLEHDVLPLTDAQSLDSETASDTSDEKSSTTTASTATAVRNPVRLKKSYLPAGLFSDYFKTAALSMVAQKTQNLTQPAKKGDKKDSSTTTPTTPTNTDSHTSAVTESLLPPPPYCEKYFRRSQQDFELPYDVWWAYTNSKLPTRITVPSWNYRKIRTNVYAESVRPNTAGLDHPTCNCKPDMGCGDNCLNRMVYTECSPSSCPTRDKCRNQKIQRHEVAPGVERFMTENKGWGVRTKLPIIKGTYILEYVGEVVTEREFKDRMGTIYLNDTHHYCLHLDGGLVIDGHRMGSDGRFVNHSCQPNCEMQKWSVNGLSRMALFAKRNIEAGEELSYDYNFSLFNPSEGQPCRCNTPQCRGVIGGKSQRIKPLPVEVKPCEPAQKDARNGRQRKRKARKNTERMQSKDVVVSRVQQLSEKEKKLVKLHAIFLVRNFEKIRRCKARHNANANDSKVNAFSSAPSSPNGTSTTGGAAAITSRRPSTPSSLAAQISALCSPRNMKTRGLTLAVQDPEVEKMAKIAVILRDICAALEALKDPSDEKLSLISTALAGVNSSANNSKKKKALKAAQKQEPIDLKTVQANIEQGYYKQPAEFDADMQKIFAEAKQSQGEDKARAKALAVLTAAYESKKQKTYMQLLELVGGDAMALGTFREPQSEQANSSETEQHQSKADPKAGTANKDDKRNAATATNKSTKQPAAATSYPTEDIIRCICGLYKDEGLMIQCARCMVWQHTECTKADVNADNYLCERCEPRNVDREIPLEDFTDEGHRYYLTLMRGDLHVRQGDAVYVLRDIPIKDAEGKVVPTQKHTYETIGDIDYNECDIFRVERLWKNEQGKRFIFGHHFLRPHETFHEPSRRFYPNEVVRVPLYEVVPIELVIGRCWVLDRTTFCKGRPVECNEEEHCYICELRVDKSARFFSKAKVNYPTCTKSYAFRKFSEKLKISKTYAPHDVDPAMLKTKKQKTDIEAASNSTGPSTAATPNPAPTAARPDLNKTPQSARKQRQSSSSPATMHLIAAAPRPTLQTLKEKRLHLANVLKAIKLKWKNTHAAVAEPPIDLSYLLSGRGARQRKTLTATATTATTAAAATAAATA